VGGVRQGWVWEVVQVPEMKSEEMLALLCFLISNTRSGSEDAQGAVQVVVREPYGHPVSRRPCSCWLRPVQMHSRESS
jgi:hypothetical protein